MSAKIITIAIEKGGTGAALASTAVQVLNAYFSNASASSAVTGENALLGWARQNGALSF